MGVYKRYFRVTEGPVIEVIKEARAINAKANEEYAKIIDEVGAEDRYYVNGGKLIGFMFAKKPDRYLWKQLRNGGWWPKRNIKAGKALLSRLKEIETKNPEDSLQLVGLQGDGHPRMFANSKVYFCTLLYLPDEIPTAYIQVPWFDCDPEKLAQYRKDREAGVRGDISMDALDWEPTPEMVEIKEWEMMKHLDAWNAKVKGNEKPQ